MLTWPPSAALCKIVFSRESLFRVFVWKGGGKRWGLPQPEPIARWRTESTQINGPGGHRAAGQERLDNAKKAVATGLNQRRETGFV